MKQGATDRIRQAPAERADDRSRQDELLAEAERLYQIYGRPLESEHWGKYVAISRDGRTLLGETADEVFEQAGTLLGPENFVLRVGEFAIGKVR